MFHLPGAFAEEMKRHALEEDPNECCGILAGKEGRVLKLYRMTNVEASPYRYSMDPKELYRTWRAIEDRGWELMAIYHSHTHSAAYPSATDVRLATWPEACYLLISLQNKEAPELRAFRIINGQVTEEPLKTA